LKIVWLSSPNRLFEEDWLMELFAGTSHKPSIQFIDESYQISHKPTVLICSIGSQYRNIIQQFNENNVRYGIVLLSDEHLSEEVEWLDNQNCVFLARNYYNPMLTNNPKVWFFGLGYRNGFKATHVVGNNNKYLWSFAGAMHNKTRVSCMKRFRHIRPNFQHLTTAFFSSEGLDLERYKQMLVDSTFCLCPQGHVNNDSFRICECLIAGCIPVVLTSDSLFFYNPSYWHALYNEVDVPFVIGKTWADCYREVKSLIGTPEELSKRRESCRSFWMRQQQNWIISFEESFNILSQGSSFYTRRIDNIVQAKRRPQRESFPSQVFRKIYQRIKVILHKVKEPI
jgi:hypothetical protein